jgi:hypothetical protein
MRLDMRTFASAILLTIFGASAHAQSLQLDGKFGYLGEYELTAEVAAPASNKEFSGRMTVRHVGLCSHSGPNEMDGQIKLRFTDATSKIAATLSFDGHQCTYGGRMSETEVGVLVCSGDAVPFSIWLK